MTTPEIQAPALMRSVLTVPVVVPRFIEKAPASGADVICLDLEDSIPPAEKVAAREPAARAIAPLIETAAGVLNAAEICRASLRVSAAVFGAEDLATDLGIQRTRAGDEVRWARTQVAIACHAARVIPIDTPDPDYSDEAYLEGELRLARS